MCQLGSGEIVAMFGVDCASGSTFTDGFVQYTFFSLYAGSLHYTMTSMHVPAAVISLALAVIPIILRHLT